MFKKSLRAIFLLAVLCAVAISGTLISPAGAQQQGTDRKLIAYAEQISGDTFPFVTRTSNGVRVFARSRPRTEVLVAINEGFTELFRIARRHGYTRRLNYSDYTVFIGRADRLKDSQGNYSPDVAVPAGQYAGSGYDQGGFIYAGGMVLTFNPSAFLIAEHDRAWQRVSNVVRYEGEHLVLYFNDRALYNKTADHSTGGYHPILQ
ncbi:MAG: hypothetical protein ICV60_01940 [Pyrinomonadaceae bacterium]|nr:hypothetical protein [Pyrinomonadaceae bacterium]